MVLGSQCLNAGCKTEMCAKPYGSTARAMIWERTSFSEEGYLCQVLKEEVEGPESGEGKIHQCLEVSNPTAPSSAGEKLHGGI